MIYKFLNKGDVPSMLSGSLMIRSLRYFREMEGEEWIADRMEGRVEALMNFVQRPSNKNFDEVNARLKAVGIVNESNGEITFNDSRAGADFGDIFVFCCSREPFEDARKAICEDAPLMNRYDGCVSISDINALGMALEETGTVDGKPLRAIFREFAARDVSYTKVIGDFTKELPLPDPFQKPAKFSDQRELRIAFIPWQRLDYKKPLFVRFDPAGLLSEVLT